MDCKFKIGEEVWVASNDRTEKRIVCDCCCGTGQLTVIMGDKTQVSVECTGCQSGYEPPRGYNVLWEPKARSIKTVVTKIEVEAGGVRYFTRAGFGGDAIFATQREADVEAIKLGQQCVERQKEGLRTKDHEKRTWSWHATYHRREIERAKEAIEYHTQKLNTANLKKKTEKK